MQERKEAKLRAKLGLDTKTKKTAKLATEKRKISYQNFVICFNMIV